MAIQAIHRKIKGPYLAFAWVGPSVPYRAQHHTNWCWAACIEMVRDGQGRPIDQCEVANHCYGPDCCDGTGNGCSGQGPAEDGNVQCNKRVSPDKNQQLWEDILGGSPTRLERILSETELIDEVSLRPVECWVRLPGTQTSHLVLVVAYDEDQDKFKVHDPCIVRAVMDYDEVKNCNGYWVWQETWINLG